MTLISYGGPEGGAAPRAARANTRTAAAVSAARPPPSRSRLGFIGQHPVDEIAVGHLEGRHLALLHVQRHLLCLRRRGVTLQDHPPVADVLSLVGNDEGQHIRYGRVILERYAASAEARSEEHTSELQSPCNLVRRFLLEKK